MTKIGNIKQSLFLQVKIGNDTVYDFSMIDFHETCKKYPDMLLRDLLQELCCKSIISNFLISCTIYYAYDSDVISHAKTKGSYQISAKNHIDTIFCKNDSKLKEVIKNYDSVKFYLITLLWFSKYSK